MIVAGFYDCTAVCWSMVDGRHIQMYRGHTGAVLCVNFEREHNLVFTSSFDHTVKIWNLLDGSCLKSHVQSIVIGSIAIRGVKELEFKKETCAMISADGGDLLITGNAHFKGKSRFHYSGMIAYMYHSPLCIGTAALLCVSKTSPVLCVLTSFENAKILVEIPMDVYPHIDCPHTCSGNFEWLNGSEDHCSLDFSVYVTDNTGNINVLKLST
eukprot:m.42501 g.42501  ORF g.42501 m.42501 type:complete len:212 (+) comp33360_c0_seq6:696-1331(+)